MLHSLLVDLSFFMLQVMVITPSQVCFMLASAPASLQLHMSLCCAGTPLATPLPLETPETKLQSSFLTLCRSHPEDMAELVYSHKEEPVRCFRALVYWLNWQSGLRRSDIESLLQADAGVMQPTPEVAELIQKKQDECEARVEAHTYRARALDCFLMALRHDAKRSAKSPSARQFDAGRP